MTVECVGSLILQKRRRERLLLSGVLSASAQHELEEVAQALDPLSLAEQLEQLQHQPVRQ